MSAILLRQVFVILLMLPVFYGNAQDLTGTWEGDLGNDQFLQLNIMQTGNRICGYTRDHVKADKRSYCKAFFEGYYDRDMKKLIIAGKYFIENSGSHVLMEMNLTYKKESGIDVLEERPSLGSRILSMISGGSIFDLDSFIAEEPATTSVYLRRVSKKPNEARELMKDCIARDKKPVDSIAKSIKPDQQKTKPPVVQKENRPEIKKENPVTEKPTVKEPELPMTKNEEPVLKTPEVLPVPKTVTQRRNKEQSRIEITVPTINIKVYDNAIMDGDTVSILYNGKMLLRHQPLTEKGIEINLDLDKNQTIHEITLFAENLGSIPPNTALVVVTAGDRRYELFASANLEENAVLVFEYKPK